MIAYKEDAAEPVVSAMTVTPATAARILEKNTRNRTIRPFHVAAMARDMKAGRFIQNGDPIRFFEDGTLADGQHRLTALIRAQVSLPFVMVHDLPLEAMQTIDGGMKRTHGDRLALTGAQNAKTISAALSVMAILAQGTYRAKLTAPEVFAAFAMHPDVEAAAMQCKNTGLGLDSIMTAFVYIGHVIGKGDEIDAFAQTIKTGVGSGQRDPAFVTREKIIKARSGIARMHRDGLIAILCAGWAAASEGREVSRIVPGRFTKAPQIDGWSKDNMPVGCGG